ncbi:LOW QUALITY PROTEIN: Pentatricopeptide repeat [Dillenia turbinata]|uniref:Pentatricopeptide repeat n=1 Tax=Dillenia turbinata TaxID=194707 RepID=A0AAN8ZKC0_9MAGN
MSQLQQLLVGKLIFLIKQCNSIKSLQQIHAQMLVNSMHKPNFLLPKLIDLKDFNYASLLFSQIPQPNDYAYNVMIRGLTTTWHKYDLSIKLYYQMKFSGLKPDNFTYPFLFIACANLLALNHGRVAHSLVFRSGLDVDGHVRHSLITMYSRCAELGCARQVFDEITERDLVSWNSMISGYTKMGFAAEAVHLFGKMRNAGFEPDEMTLVSILGACGAMGNLSLGSWVERFVEDHAMELNTYMGSSLIDMYGKCGDFLSARRVFDKMVKKDVITWNAMITGQIIKDDGSSSYLSLHYHLLLITGSSVYAQNGMSEEAITLFNHMRSSGVKLNEITLVGVLSACASVGALDLGLWLDTYASERGLQNDVYVATALVDMYAKCGSLELALKVFKNMPHKNEVSWNAMITALAHHGRAKEALSLFEQMSIEGNVRCPVVQNKLGVYG